jgi:nucleotide-binding universal stress UspA family protein
VDGSEPSNRGMFEAIHLAHDQQASLHFLFVACIYIPLLDMAGEFNVDRLTDMLRKSGEHVLKKAVAAAEAEGVKAEYSMRDSYEGRAGEAIVAKAHEWPADLIVMGTHGYRGFDHFVMGSDAEFVIRHSPAPVLLARCTQLIKPAAK